MQYLIYSCFDQRVKGVILDQKPVVGEEVTLKKPGFELTHTDRYSYVKEAAPGIFLCRTSYFKFRARLIQEDSGA